jgi:hypothetical protein
MKYLGITFLLVLFISCVGTSGRKAGAEASVEKDRLLAFYTGEIANIFGKKLNDVRIRDEFFSGQNDFDTNQWIGKHLSREIQYYERKIEDDWRGYLRSNAPGQIARDSNRLYNLVQIIGDDFKLMVEMYLIDWKKRHETKYKQGLPL